MIFNSRICGSFTLRALRYCCYAAFVSQSSAKNRNDRKEMNF